MKPVKILSEGRVLPILVDSDSLSQKYDNNPKSLNFLYYSFRSSLDIKRTPVETGLHMIDSLPIFQPEIEGPGNTGLMENIMADRTISLKIDCKLVDIPEKFLQKPKITAEEKKKIEGIFLHACMHYQHGPNIYITCDDTLLQNRDWFLEHPLDKPIIIATVDEGKEIMDIFRKYLGIYLITPQIRADAEYYYWISFISRMHHYRSPSQNVMFDIDTDTVPLHALAHRFRYALKCVDEMGANYYRGIDVDAINEIRFYFNYFIILITGIFDSLAFVTKTKYNITFEGDHMPSKISLNNNARKDFLKEVKNENCDLHCHIESNREFINMIYKFRDRAVHGDFRSREHRAIVNDSLTHIDSYIAQVLSHLEGKRPKYDDYSDWGRVKRSNKEYISLYIFSKRVKSSLIDFVDMYLEKLELVGHIMTDPKTYDGQLAKKFLEEN